jgi:hypothetical protein
MVGVTGVERRHQTAALRSTGRGSTRVAALEVYVVQIELVDGLLERVFAVAGPFCE